MRIPNFRNTIILELIIIIKSVELCQLYLLDLYSSYSTFIYTNIFEISVTTILNSFSQKLIFL